MFCTLCWNDTDAVVVVVAPHSFALPLTFFVCILCLRALASCAKSRLCFIRKTSGAGCTSCSLRSCSSVPFGMAVVDVAAACGEVCCDVLPPLFTYCSALSLWKCVVSVSVELKVVQKLYD